MRTGYVVVLLVALIIGWNIPADAQRTPFKYQVTPYLWLWWPQAPIRSLPGLP
jgi:hypothetical protein